MIFKLVKKQYLKKLVIYVCLSVFVYTGYNQRLQRESNFILFCIFDYVTYVTSYTLNPFYR